MNKGMEWINFFELNALEAGGPETRKGKFLMKYWLEKVSFRNVTQERFLFLQEESELRKQYSAILKSHTIRWHSIRFDEHLGFVLIDEKGLSK